MSRKFFLGIRTPLWEIKANFHADYPATGLVKYANLACSMYLHFLFKPQILLMNELSALAIWIPEREKLEFGDGKGDQETKYTHQLQQRDLKYLRYFLPPTI